MVVNSAKFCISQLRCPFYVTPVQHLCKNTRVLYGAIFPIGSVLLTAPHSPPSVLKFQCSIAFFDHILVCATIRRGRTKRQHGPDGPETKTVARVTEAPDTCLLNSCISLLVFPQVVLARAP